MCDAYSQAQVTSTDHPVPGDLIVYDANSCGALTAGHVAVVDLVPGDGTARLVEQNYLGDANQRTVSLGCSPLCYLHANTNIRVCETLPMPVDPPPTDPSVGLDFACGNSMRDRGPTWEDWSRGFRKAACSVSQAATGLSMSMDSYRYAHALLCREDDTERYPHTDNYDTCRKVVFNVEDNRGTTITGDWDPGFLKGECAEGEFVAGVSQTTNQALHAILCCQGQVTHDQCAPLVFDNQDAREDPTANDWDPGYHKGECGPGRYMAGASMTALTGVPHAILCCGEPVVEPPDAGVPDASPTVGDASLVLGGDAEEPPPQPHDGCGCNAGGGGPFGGWLWIVLCCAGALALRRRRRHRAGE
jgi:hypothetical protein